MKVKVKSSKKVEVNTLHVSAGVRYWEDSEVNGVTDETGDLIPCKDGDRWKPIIDVKTGQILNWSKGVKADIHYKVCDDGIYILKDKSDKIIVEIDSYVPNTLCPKEEGYGDYIIMDIDENGFIKDFKFDPEDFENSSDEEE